MQLYQFPLERARGPARAQPMQYASLTPRTLRLLAHWLKRVEPGICDLMEVYHLTEERVFVLSFGPDTEHGFASVILEGTPTESEHLAHESVRRLIPAIAFQMTPRAWEVMEPVTSRVVPCIFLPILNQKQRLGALVY